MSGEHAPLRQCHERHSTVEDVIFSFLRNPRTTVLKANDYLGALSVAMSPEWLALRCGHFTQWLWEELLAHLGSLAQHPDNRVIENTVECWYDLSGRAPTALLCSLRLL